MSNLTRHWMLPNLLLWVLSGCTTLVSHDEIEPYIKEKPKRNSLETLAENYCVQKRAGPGGSRPASLPDYIYTTDGCSRWPDGSWAVCCIVHDIAYWCGGDDKDRHEADEWLKQCANEKAGGMGSIIYLGVRMGGLPWLPTPWRWGYGWDNWPHGYEILSHSPSVTELIENLKIRRLVEEQLEDIKNDHRE